MPNWKYPCIECQKPVKSNQKGLECDICKKWVHFKCTDLTQGQFIFLEVNEDIPFYCLVCKPRLLYADAIQDMNTEYLNSNLNSPPNLSVEYNSDCEFSSAHSSDFEYVDESDSESRGLNFDSLPTKYANKPSKKNTNNHISSKHIFLQTRNYKYPCVICLGPCKEKCQDSICCSLCDEWTHKKCSNLTLDQFNKYCSPENAEIPFYCDICLYGSNQNHNNQTCLRASEISTLDTNDIYNLCPNSVFKDLDDIPTTEYFTIDELNVEAQKSSDNLCIIHINAVSLCKNINSITDMIAGLDKQPSIIFISETRVHDEKEKLQKKTNSN